MSNEGIKLILKNDHNLIRLFENLDTKKQKRVIDNTLKASGRIINKQAKQNFNLVKKNQSRTNYSEFNRMFKVQSKRPKPDELGVLVGMKHREGYKYRFIEYGTASRYTRKGNYYRGKIEKNSFFYSAVTQTKEKVKNTFSEGFIKSLNNVVKRMNK